MSPTRAPVSVEPARRRHSASSRSARRGAPAENRHRPRGDSRTRTPAAARLSTERWIVDNGLPVARAISVKVAPSVSSTTSTVDATGSESNDVIVTQHLRVMRRCQEPVWDVTIVPSFIGPAGRQANARK